MLPQPRSWTNRLQLLAIASFILVGIAGCLDTEDAIAPRIKLQASVLGLSVDSLVGDEPFVAIARELPSFGGFYFTEGEERVVVALTDVSDFDRAVELIKPWLGSNQPRGGFVPSEVRYSFRELARHRTLLRRRIFKLPGVVSLGVDEINNRVNIGIAQLSARSQVRSLLGSLNVPEEAMIFRREAEAILLSHTTLSSSIPNDRVRGGYEIAGGGICTLGFPAVQSNGNEVFVTNSHCTEDLASYDGGPFFQPRSGDRIGSELSDPAFHVCDKGWPERICRHADAALIDASDPIDLGRIARTTRRDGDEGDHGSKAIDHANPTLRISSLHGHVFSNEILDKIGWKTGWTYGAVESTCDDTSIGPFIQRCSDRVDFHAEGGDSGSPVFDLKSNGTIELRGIVFGWKGWPYSDAMMSDLHQIALDLGNLMVIDAPLNVNITGVVSAPPNTNAQWCANAGGGRPPYSYEWRRNGSFVDSDDCYFGNTGFSSFTLTVKVTDGESDVDTDNHFVTVEDGPELVRSSK